MSNRFEKIAEGGLDAFADWDAQEPTLKASVQNNIALEDSYGDLYNKEVLESGAYNEDPEIELRKRIEANKLRKQNRFEAEESVLNEGFREKMRTKLEGRINQISKDVPGFGVASLPLKWAIEADRYLAVSQEAIAQTAIGSLRGISKVIEDMPASAGVGAPGVVGFKGVGSTEKETGTMVTTEVLNQISESLPENLGVDPDVASSTAGKFVQMASQLAAGVGVSAINPSLAVGIFTSSAYDEATEIYDEYAENPTPEGRMRAGLMVAIPTAIATRVGDVNVAKFISNMSASTRKQLLGQWFAKSGLEAAGEQGELLAMRFMMNTQTTLDVDYFDEENLKNFAISFGAAGALSSKALFKGLSGRVTSILDGEDFSQKSFKQLQDTVGSEAIVRDIENPAIRELADAAFKGNVEAQQTIASLYDLDQATPLRPGKVGEKKLSKAQVNSDRIQREAETLPVAPQEKQTFKQWNKEALEERIDQKAIEIVDNYENKGIVPTAKEHAGILIKQTELENDYDAAQDRVRDLQAAGKFEQAAKLDQASRSILNDIDRIERASVSFGSEIARALVVRRMAIKRDDYSTAKLTRDAQVFAKRELDQDEAQLLQERSKELVALQEEIKAAQAELEKLQEPQGEVPSEQELNQKVERAVKRGGKKGIEEKIAELEKTLKRKQEVFIGKAPEDIDAEVEAAIQKAAFDNDPRIKNLKSRIAFYNKSERESAQIEHLESKFFRFNKLLTGNDDAAIRQEIGPPPDWTKKKEVVSYLDKLKKLTDQQKAELIKRVSPDDPILKEVKSGPPKGKNTLVKLQNELKRQEAIFNGEQKIAAREKIELTEEQQAIQDKINFFKSANDDARRVNVLEDELLRVTAIDANSDITAMRNEFGIKTKWNEEKAVQQYIQDLKARISSVRDNMRIKVRVDDQRLAMEAAYERLINAQSRMSQKRDQLQKDYRGMASVFKDWAKELYALPRLALSTYDMGATFRQGLLATIDNPVRATKIFGKSAWAGIQQKKYFEMDAELRFGNPQMAAVREEAGLFLSNIDKLNLTQREEAFSSSWAERIPIAGAGVRFSERAMVTTLNQLRVAAFDDFVRKHPDATLEQRKAWAAFVNSSTGRGNIKVDAKNMERLNKLFFAPRFLFSRFETPIITIGRIAKNREIDIVSKARIRQWAKLAGTYVVVAKLASLAGWEVGTDPDEADFLKITNGTTRMDVLGSFGQTFRVLAIPVDDIVNDRWNYETSNITEAYMKFLSFKLNPGTTIPLSIIGGRNIINQEQEISETAVRAVTPLLIQEAYDAYELEGPLQAAGTAAGTFVGLGIQNY